QGHVGVGLARATGVPEAIRKAASAGRKALIEVPVVKGSIPQEILAKFGAARVLLKPAAPGSGMIASTTVRAVLELAGVKDIISKSLGSSNRVNVAKATMIALANLKKPEKTVTESELEFDAQEENLSEAE
ncbi:MAG: 30S ribosomal protein S5, partial [Chloroflexota bacterium]|nr:30S ribosomal protein S5 [Chloroflexota bacterium]